MIDKTKREIGLVQGYASPAIRIVGPFTVTTKDGLDSVSLAILMAEKSGQHPPKGYRWMHAYWGEITRAKDCIIEAPVERTLTYQGIP